MTAALPQLARAFVGAIRRVVAASGVAPSERLRDMIAAAPDAPTAYALSRALAWDLPVEMRAHATSEALRAAVATVEAMHEGLAVDGGLVEVASWDHADARAEVAARCCIAMAARLDGVCP